MFKKSNSGYYISSLTCSDWQEQTNGGRTPGVKKSREYVWGQIMLRIKYQKEPLELPNEQIKTAYFVLTTR